MEYNKILKCVYSPNNYNRIKSIIYFGRLKLKDSLAEPVEGL